MPSIPIDSSSFEDELSLLFAVRETMAALLITTVDLVQCDDSPKPLAVNSSAKIPEEHFDVASLSPTGAMGSATNTPSIDAESKSKDAATCTEVINAEAKDAATHMETFNVESKDAATHMEVITAESKDIATSMETLNGEPKDAATNTETFNAESMDASTSCYILMKNEQTCTLGLPTVLMHDMGIGTTSMESEEPMDQQLAVTPKRKSDDQQSGKEDNTTEFELPDLDGKFGS